MNNIITPAEMYWLLKLDDIRSIVIAVAIVALLITIVAWALCFIFNGPCYEDVTDKERNTYLRRAVVSAIITIVIGLSAAAMPSTKQYAAIKVIPLIVNSDAAKKIATDASDIYSMGIKALKEVLTDDSSKESAK